MGNTELGLAVVTGGAGGIGAAVCQRLALSGQRVVVTDLDATKATAIAEDLPGEGHTALALDVADTELVRSTLDGVADEHGPISTLVNVAGWDRFIPFVDTTPEFLGSGYCGQLSRHAEHGARRVTRDDRTTTGADRVGRI